MRMMLLRELPTSSHKGYCVQSPKSVFAIVQRILLFFFILFLAYSGQSQQVTWSLRAGGAGADAAVGTHIDAAGNVYMVGEFQGTNVDFDPGPGNGLLSSNGSSDGFVAKYTSAGQYLFSFSIGGSNIDKVHGVSTDAAGNIYITGFFRGPNVDFDPSAASALLSSNGDAGGDPGYGGDIFVAKYSATGQYQWAFNVGGTTLADAGIMLKASAAGDVFVGGYFRETVDFNPSATVTNSLNSTNGVIFLARYNTNGQYQWAINFGQGNTDNSLFDLRIDASDNVYVTGYFQGSNIDFDPGGGSAPLNSNGSYEAFVAKYSPAGQYIFAFSIGGNALDVGRGIVLDNAGNIYVIGDFNDAGVDFDPSPATALLSSIGLSDVFIAKYTNNGQYVWAKRVGSTSGEFGWKIDTDNSSIFITGGFNGVADFDPSAATDNLTSNGGYDIFLAKYDLSGNYQCAFNVGAADNDFGNDILIAGQDRFYLVGSFQGNVDFAPTQSTAILNSAGSSDAFLTKYLWPPNTMPVGTLQGSTICLGQPGMLTFTSSSGTSPFTITYTDGANTYTQSNVQSGIPFPTQMNPAVATTYTLTSILDGVRCSPVNNAPAASTTVNVQACAPPVTASFTNTETVCVGAPVTITNTSVGASTYYWNFCQGNINQPPIGANLGNVGGNLQKPVFIDYVFYNNNYYGFLVNHAPGRLIRLNFGNSLLNTPTSTDLGNFNGILPSLGECVQVVQNEGRWYAIIVAGSTAQGVTPRIIKIDFGPDLTNVAPVATNWGNLGNMEQPIDLHVFQENGNWYGFTVNSENNTITRFSFTNSFNNTPTAVNLGNIGNLAYPTGIYAINDNNFWRVFVVNGGDVSRVTGVWSLTRLDFGSSLLNTPTGVNLGNPGGVLKHPRDLTLMKFCGEIVGFAVNAAIGSSELVRMNFGTDLSSTPTMVSLGNIGNMSYPHSISKIFRDGADLYSFITNVDNNTMIRLRFAGCTNSSIPNSTLQNPPAITYNAPGTYNINLTVDDGLPTQTAFCKQVVVQNCTDSIVINDYTEAVTFDNCKNALTVGDASEFNVGDTVLVIQMKGATTDVTNTATFGNITNYGSAGNYEFNYVKAKNGNVLELVNVLTRSYDFVNGKVQLVRVPYFENYTANRVLTCLPWDGNKGGILVFNVGNTLTLNRKIDVSGRGYKGGRGINTNQTTTNCFANNYSYPFGNILAAAKGESAVLLPANVALGKGNAASGGGGGNDHNSGGGGGGNGGPGGFGGYQYEPCGNAPFDNRGIGGRALSYSNAANKIFMGGGGGAGHANNPENIALHSDGGNGGGIILISAQSITSNSFKIMSNGADAPEFFPSGPQHTHEATGGGGAGGTVVLNIPNITDNTIVETKGGKGADMHANVPLYGRIGPGGGGGGGVLWSPAAFMPANISFIANGGERGVLTADANNPWGTTVGNAGTAVFDLQLPANGAPFQANIDSVRFNSTQTGCSSFNFEGFGYTKILPVATWQWFFGDGNVASTQNASHTYANDGTYTVKLLITDANGCKDSISRTVQAFQSSVDYNYDQDVCDPFTIHFTGLDPAAPAHYWEFGDGVSITGPSSITHTYTTPGNYIVRYAVSNGVCSDTITKTINVDVIRENIILTQDTTICLGATKQLLTVPSLDFCWTPVTYLNDPNLANPTTSATQDITYYFTAKMTGNNLIVNGNFSQGNTGFTSDYTHITPNLFEAQYFIGTNPQAWNGNLTNCGDHTTGASNMMMVNGSPTIGAKVWQQTVAVAPNTNYAFSTWIQSVSAPNPAQLQFSINGKTVGNTITASLPTCTWTRFYTTWNSGNNTSADISIVNNNTIAAGNDFALDDISFAPVFIKRDSVKITVERPVVTTNNDTTICIGGSVQLNATGAQSYVWSPSAGLSNASIANPLASPADTTRYIVAGTTATGCVARDTVYVNVFEKSATVNASGDATICQNMAATLLATGGVIYSWSPAATLSNPGISNPVATPSSTTKYYVTITDVNTCSYLDSVEIEVRPTPVFNASGPSMICLNDSAKLNASGGDIYSWQPATGLTDPSIANPVASPGSTTNYSVTITELVCNQSQTFSVNLPVRSLPEVKAFRSADLDCSNDHSQLNATGASSFLWSPSASLSSTTIHNPVARPAVTTRYYVKGTDAMGCSNYDSVVVKVDNVNNGGYLMPNAFTPDGDGLNDCYGIKYWGIIYEVEFSIFNRWGERIFFTKDPNQCWDGTYKGVKQDPNVFVYMIKAKTNCEPSVFKKGTFVLIR
jgi:gliding motility-associated-like protein